MSIQFNTLTISRLDYRACWVILIGLVIAGYLAAHYMDVNGHYVTGMNNQVVWGIPHVFALGLILAASGALNIASLSSAFAIAAYKPLARLSALLAIALLIGGLLILVFDLGRPDRLLVAMTHYNFKSVFAWNIFLYIGFIAVVVAYLWAMFEPRFDVYARRLGVLSLLWRFILTSGSGAIFGFLVARPAYDAAILVPLFILLSMSLGTATFLLVAMTLARWHPEYLDHDVLRRLARLLALFLGTVIFMTLVFHLTNLYAAEHHGVERFILLEGGVYTALFWFVQLGIGGVIPLAILFSPRLSHAHTLGAMRALFIAAVLVVLGGIAQLYVIIIGGQAFPMSMFPGKVVTSSFYDGVIASYVPSLPEWLLGLGGVAVALLIVLMVIRVLPFMPAVTSIKPSPDRTGST